LILFLANIYCIFLLSVEFGRDALTREFELFSQVTRRERGGRTDLQRRSFFQREMILRTTSLERKQVFGSEFEFPWKQEMKKRRERQHNTENPASK
jgi:hypothetical protein